MLAFRIMDYLNYRQWDISAIDIGVLVGYFLVMMLVGMICSKSSSDVSDYIRMGCKSTWWLMGLSIFMQAISAGTFTGNCAQAYMSGWSAFLIGLGGVFGLVCQAVFFAPWMRRTRAVTPADAVRQRFGPLAEQVFTYVGAFGGVFWGGVMLLGLANFVSATFLIPIDTVILFVGVVIVFYSVSGGSWSVQITDTLQSFIMVPICLVVAFLSLKAVGGLDGLLDAIQANGLTEDYRVVMDVGHEYTSKAGRVRPGYFTIPWMIASFLYSFILSANMTNCHRYLSTKSDSEARKAAILAAVLLLMGSFVWYIPPMVGRVQFEAEIDALKKVHVETPALVVAEAGAGDTDASEAATPQHVAPKTGKINNPADGAYATVAKKLLPPGLLGLVIIAMFAATMSSMDSALTGTAGLITKNLYPPLARLFGSVPKEGKTLLRMTQTVNLLLGIWAITMAYLLNNMSGDKSIYDVSLNIVLLVSVPTVLSFALSFFVRHLPKWGPLVGMGCGFIASANFMFIGKIADAHPDIIWLGDWAVWCKDLMWHQKMYINCAMTLIPTLLTALFWSTSKPDYRQQVDRFFEQLRTPVDFDKEVGSSADHSLLKMVGWLGLLIAAMILTLVFFARGDDGMLDSTSVWSILFIAGFIATVSLWMLVAGKMKAAAIEAEVSPAAAELINSEDSDDLRGDAGE